MASAVQTAASDGKDNFLATRPREAHREIPFPVFATFFVYALYAAAENSAHSVQQPWFVVGSVLLASVIAAFPTPKSVVDKVLGEETLRQVIKMCYCSEWLGLSLIGFGVWLANLWFASGMIMQLLGALIAAECTQLFRVQRMTSGVKATTLYRIIINTIGSFGHHFASCLCLPNNPTIIFVTFWRASSIISHALRHLESFGLSMRFVHFMSWARFYICVCFIQPVFFLILAGHFLGWLPEGHVLAELADGLKANCVGHLYYIIYRGHRLVDLRKNPPFDMHYLHIELFWLTLDALVALVAALEWVRVR